MPLHVAQKQLIKHDKVTVETNVVYWLKAFTTTTGMHEPSEFEVEDVGGRHGEAEEGEVVDNRKEKCKDGHGSSEDEDEEGESPATIKIPWRHALRRSHSFHSAHS